LPDSSRDSIFKALRVALSLLVLIPPAFVMFFVARYGVDVPDWDEWFWGQLFAKLPVSTHPLADIWIVHSNEHRLFFATLIALALAHAGGWSPMREMFFSIFIMCGSLLIVVQLARATVPAGAQAPVLAASSALLFSLSQVDNWLWGFQLAWFLITFCLLAEIALLTADPPGWAKLSLAAVAGFVASFSSAFGLLALPVGFAILVARERRSTPMLLSWAIFSGAVFALYLIGYEAPTALAPMHAPGHLIDEPLWVIAFVGAPIAQWAGVAGAVAFGLAGLLALVALVVWSWRSGRRAALQKRLLPWLALVLYSLLGAAMLAFGRVGFGPAYALTSRYTSIALTFWIGLIAMSGIVLTEYFGDAPPRAARVASLVLAVLLVASFVQTQRTGWDEALSLNARRERGLAAVRQYASASDLQLGNITWDPEMVRTLLPKLISIGQAPFVASR
jgi:hypothetical protein